MKAVVITRPGGPEVLELRDVPDPSCGPDEVCVRVHATALNRADILQRRGQYPAPPGAPPDIPGLELAGTVETCGDRVRELAIGDRVMGIVGGGGHAERVCLHERACIRVPRTLDWVEAAAVPEAFLTAHDALARQARLGAGETLLLWAAASGVGTAAAQLAAACGATVIGLSRTPAKRERLLALGVTHVLDPARAELAAAIVACTDGRGVDVVLELVGAPSWPVDVEVLRTCGRLVVLGLLGGARADVDLGVLMRKRLTVIGSVLRSRPLEQKIELAQDFGRHVLPLFAAGRVRPVVDRTFPLSRVAEAHEHVERDRSFGKVVLTLGGG